MSSFRHATRLSIQHLACLALLALLGSSPALAQDSAGEATFGSAPDPAKVVGHEACAKCHGAELRQWMGTPHFRTFETLHRTDEAKTIAKKLGLRSVKRNETCVRCHYTQQQKGSRPRIVAGVSCESCHGAATDWLTLHSDYGAGATKESETAEHKQQRRDQSIAAGMNNPSNLYLIAKQCLGCHTTPNEALVNVGGHKPGSDAFELVSWSQGSIRHNFQRTNGEFNAPSTLPRVRVMYLIGQLADLEASLRATAKATTAETFGKTAANRAARVKQRLWEAQRLLNDPLLAQALDPLATVQLRLNNAAELNAAAETVGKIANRFATEADGETMAAIDSLLPPPSQYK